MNTFTNIVQLETFLAKDLNTQCLCPVRFINVENMRDWILVKCYLEKLCSNTITLSGFCETIDVTPNLRLLNNNLRSLKTTSLLIPLSEHLRINNQTAKEILLGLFNMKFKYATDINFKLYIPLYRMKTLLNILEPNPRQRNSILYLENIADTDYSLTIVQKTLCADIPGNIINNYREYLVYWEQNPDKPIVLHTQNAVHFRDIVVSDDVTVIVTPFELLREYFHISENVKSEWGKDEYWKLLLSNYTKDQSIYDILSNHLGIRDFSFFVFENWQSKADFEKWLIWLWAKLDSKSEYLKGVCLKSNQVEDFEQSLLIFIFDCLDENNYSSLYQERLSLIEIMNISPTVVFWDRYNLLTPFKKLKSLTDFTEKEKVEMFIQLSELPLNNSVLKIIKQNYFQLYAYLKITKFDNQLLTNYFDMYKQQKATNKVENEFLSIVDLLARDKCETLWKLPSRNSLVDEIYTDKTIVLFVDAFGVEFCTLIQSILENSGYYITIEFGHCNIPSSTIENKDFFEGKNVAKPYYELDKHKHSNVSYPYTIIKEFQLIGEIVNMIKELLETDIQQVLLSADHGTSRLAVIAKGEIIKIDENIKKYKHGRYCIDSKGDYSHLDGCIDSGDHWIFANYNRFSSQGTPLNETHGGATLEECVVPVVTIRKSKPFVENEEKVIVIWHTDVVVEQVGGIVEIKFMIDHLKKDLIAVVLNKRYPCTLNDGKYTFTHSTTKDTKYSAQIFANGIIGNITYNVIKGNTKNPNFDL